MNLAFAQLSIRKLKQFTNSESSSIIRNLEYTLTCSL